jgi:hypothetical protein
MIYREDGVGGSGLDVYIVVSFWNTAYEANYVYIYIHMHACAHIYMQKKGSGGAHQWYPKDGGAAGKVPDAHDSKRSHQPTMFTTGSPGSRRVEYEYDYEYEYEHEYGKCVRYGTAMRYDTIRYDTILIRYDTIWNGTVRYGTVFSTDWHNTLTPTTAYYLLPPSLTYRYDNI